MTGVPIAELMQTYTHAFLTAVVSRHRCNFCCVSISFFKQKCAPHTQQRLVVYLSMSTVWMNHKSQLNTFTISIMADLKKKCICHNALLWHWKCFIMSNKINHSSWGMDLRSNIFIRLHDMKPEMNRGLYIWSLQLHCNDTVNLCSLQKWMILCCSWIIFGDIALST